MYKVIVDNVALPPFYATVHAVREVARSISSIANCEVKILSDDGYLLDAFLWGKLQSRMG